MTEKKVKKEKRKMKICFLTNTLNVNSGWGRYSWNIVSRVGKEKDVFVLTEKESGYPLEKPILENAFNNFLVIFTNAFRVRKYIKKCDIVHCLDAYPYGVIGALANIGLNKKLVISGIGSYSIAPLEHWLKGYLLRWAYKKAVCVPCISFCIRNEILKRVKIKNTQVIHLGVDSDKFQKKNNIDDKSRAEKVILGVGGLKERKGYHISIPAMVQVKKKYPDFKYYIVGHQDNQFFFNQLKNLADQHQLQDNIIFLEKISDKELISLYHRSDLFLLTPVNVGSHFEGFGLVYLEAGACGKPVIGTYDCGAEEIIEEGYNGFLVPQKDIKKTSEAILKILDNSDLAQKLGQNGCQKAKQMDWSNVVNKYIEIYKNFI